MSTVRVAVVGVGNCASALIQGAALYRLAPDTPGLITQAIGPYGPGSVEVVAGFDVDPDKVLRPLREAIYVAPNCVYLPYRVPLAADDAMVWPGPVLDGVGRSLEVMYPGGFSAANLDAVVDVLNSEKVDVVVNYLPVGSTEATYAYAEAALEAGCGFVNAIPVPLAREEEWHERFTDHGLPLIGDDVKSQVGATITHRALVETFSHRGVVLDQTYQLNVGGNTDFLNMRDQERLADKRRSKLQSIEDVANRGAGIPEGQVHVGPSDYVPFLGDTKIAFVQLRGRGFGGNPVYVEMRFEGGDSPGSAGVVYDAVRWCAWARNHGVCGALQAPCAYLMKAPPGMSGTDAQAIEHLTVFRDAMLENEPEPTAPH